MKTILVVDDNFDNRYIIGQMLQISGYGVVLAASAADALKELEQRHPDLILMDMAMPDLDGWSMTAQLKAQPQLAHIPVIAVTGHVTSSDINRALNAGCRDYVTKPIDYEQLLEKVQIGLMA